MAANMQSLSESKPASPLFRMIRNATRMIQPVFSNILFALAWSAPRSKIRLSTVSLALALSVAAQPIQSLAAGGVAGAAGAGAKALVPKNAVVATGRSSQQGAESASARSFFGFTSEDALAYARAMEHGHPDAFNYLKRQGATHGHYSIYKGGDIMLNFTTPNGVIKGSFFIERSGFQSIEDFRPSALRRFLRELNNQRGAIAGQVVRQFPSVTLQFYLALGALAFYETAINHSERPMDFDNLANQFTSPEGHFAFALFMAGAASMSGPLQTMVTSKRIRAFVPYVALFAGFSLAQLYTEIRKIPGIPQCVASGFDSDICDRAYAGFLQMASAEKFAEVSPALTALLTSALLMGTAEHLLVNAWQGLPNRGQENWFLRPNQNRLALPSARVSSFNFGTPGVPAVASQSSRALVVATGAKVVFPILPRLATGWAGVSIQTVASVARFTGFLAINEAIIDPIEFGFGNLGFVASELAQSTQELNVLLRNSRARGPLLTAEPPVPMTRTLTSQCRPNQTNTNQCEKDLRKTIARYNEYGRRWRNFNIKTIQESYNSWIAKVFQLSQDYQISRNLYTDFYSIVQSEKDPLTAHLTTLLRRVPLLVGVKPAEETEASLSRQLNTPLRAERSQIAWANFLGGQLLSILTGMKDPTSVAFNSTNACSFERAQSDLELVPSDYVNLCNAGVRLIGQSAQEVRQGIDLLYQVLRTSRRWGVVQPVEAQRGMISSPFRDLPQSESSGPAQGIRERAQPNSPQLTQLPTVGAELAFRWLEALGAPPERMNPTVRFAAERNFLSVLQSLYIQTGLLKPEDVLHSLRTTGRSPLERFFVGMLTGPDLEKGERAISAPFGLTQTGLAPTWRPPMTRMNGNLELYSLLRPTGADAARRGDTTSGIDSATPGAGNSPDSAAVFPSAQRLSGNDVSRGIEHRLRLLQIGARLHSPLGVLEAPNLLVGAAEFVRPSIVQRDFPSRPKDTDGVPGSGILAPSDPRIGEWWDRFAEPELANYWLQLEKDFDQLGVDLLEALAHGLPLVRETAASLARPSVSNRLSADLEARVGGWLRYLQNSVRGTAFGQIANLTNQVAEQLGLQAMALLRTQTPQARIGTPVTPTGQSMTRSWFGRLLESGPNHDFVLNSSRHANGLILSMRQQRQTLYEVLKSDSVLAAEVLEQRDSEHNPSMGDAVEAAFRITEDVLLQSHQLRRTRGAGRAGQGENFIVVSQLSVANLRSVVGLLGNQLDCLRARCFARPASQLTPIQQRVLNSVVDGLTGQLVELKTFGEMLIALSYRQNFGTREIVRQRCIEDAASGGRNVLGQKPPGC